MNRPGKTPGSDLAPPGREPDSRPLGERIRKFRAGYEARPARWVQSMGLVFSLGVTMIGCVLLGLWLGKYLKARTGSDLTLVAGIFLGLGAGGYCVYRLLKPFLQD